jgi:hypothetical protein
MITKNGAINRLNDIIRGHQCSIDLWMKNLEHTKAEIKRIQALIDVLMLEGLSKEAGEALCWLVEKAVQ